MFIVVIIKILDKFFNHEFTAYIESIDLPVAVMKGWCEAVDNERFIKQMGIFI